MGQIDLLWFVLLEIHFLISCCVRVFVDLLGNYLLKDLPENKAGQTNELKVP